MASKLPSLPSRAARSLVIAVLRLYQRTLSPDHGWLRHLHPYGFCPFEPSCSQYAIERIRTDGLIRGIPRALWRLLRCNPWATPNRARLERLTKQVLRD